MWWAKAVLLVAIMAFGCECSNAQRAFPFHDETRYILYKAFFSINPNHTIGDNNPNFYDTSEGIRSNVLSVDLVD